MTPFVPVPTRLIDEMMPALRDTEWRVLCVVTRCTLGWVGPDGHSRKRRDWLTHAELKRRTGRAGDAVSRAVDGLVRRDLIEVVDRSGVHLTTPWERRRRRGRLYYGLSPYLIESPRPGHAPEIGVRYAERTKESVTKENNRWG